MPKGSNIKKGMRPGGRSKGTPNKATLERAELARIQTEQSKAKGLKLGKEVLEDFMHLFAGMAAAYQPLPPGIEPAPGRAPDEAKFITYATLAVKTAKDLADFQSPKFKAIMVSTPTPDQMPQPKTVGGNVVELNDAVAIARVYQRMVKQVG